MLTALRLGNFKAFGPTQRVPLKPLTDVDPKFRTRWFFTYAA